jgi:hypothetical protein
MNDRISKSLIALFLAVLLVPVARQFLDRRDYCNLRSGDCAGGGCGNLLSVQETLDRNTIRFSQPPDAPFRKTSRQPEIR